MLTSIPEWLKTLTIALISSFFAVCLVEPVKAVIQRRMRRREVRRALYQEMANNYGKLQAQVGMAKSNPNMRTGLGERFAMGFKKFSFELAQRDPATYYSLGYNELYWIELLYRDMENIITGRFTDEQHLRAAEFTADSFLSMLKNRNLSRRLVDLVGPDWVREHLRERLPEIDYVDVEPPNLLERIRRRFDQNTARAVEGAHLQKIERENEEKPKQLQPAGENRSRTTRPILEVSDKIGIAVTLLTAIILFFEDKTPAVVVALLSVAFMCGLYVLRHLVARLPWVTRSKGGGRRQFLSGMIAAGIVWAALVGWYGVRKWPKREILVGVTFKDSPVLTQKRRKNIEIDLDDFYRYLRSLGFDLPSEIPPIGVSPPHSVMLGGGGGGPAYYSSLIISEDVIDTPGIIRTVYAGYTFNRILVWPDAWKSNLSRVQVEDDEVAAWVYECYFPKSFGGQPTCDGRAPGHQWVDAMWEVREKYGQEYADSLMCYALKMWRDIPSKYLDSFDRFFRYRIAAGETAKDNSTDRYFELNAIFQRHGIDTAQP
jgi:hypothetical protein